MSERNRTRPSSPLAQWKPSSAVKASTPWTRSQCSRPYLTLLRQLLSSHLCFGIQCSYYMIKLWQLCEDQYGKTVVLILKSHYSLYKALHHYLCIYLVLFMLFYGQWNKASNRGFKLLWSTLAKYPLYTWTFTNRLKITAEYLLTQSCRNVWRSMDNFKYFWKFWSTVRMSLWTYFH